MATTAPYVDPDAGIPDLVRRLTEDSKRLVRDEARLVRLETHASLHRSARGALWLGLAFGAAVVSLVALTLMVATLLGRWIGHYWAGTLIVAGVELVVAAFLVRSGLARVKASSYTFDASRESLRDTVEWARQARD